MKKANDNIANSYLLKQKTNNYIVFIVTLILLFVGFYGRENIMDES
jgi:hypothetical protein